MARSILKQGPALLTLGASLLLLLSSSVPAEAQFEVPACVQNGASVTLTGPATSQEACDAVAGELNAALLANFPSPFSCAFYACAPFTCNCLPTPFGCMATLTALLEPNTLIRFYALDNIWAYPSGGTYGAGAYFPFIVQTNPTCPPVGPECEDLFPRILASMLGSACGGIWSYDDSCGGAATMPLACDPQFESPPLPPDAPDAPEYPKYPEAPLPPPGAPVYPEAPPPPSPRAGGTGGFPWCKCDQRVPSGHTMTFLGHEPAARAGFKRLRIVLALPNVTAPSFDIAKIVLPLRPSMYGKVRNLVVKGRPISTSYEKYKGGTQLALKIILRSKPISPTQASAGVMLSFDAPISDIDCSKPESALQAVLVYNVFSVFTADGASCPVGRVINGA